MEIPQRLEGDQLAAAEEWQRLYVACNDAMDRDSGSQESIDAKKALDDAYSKLSLETRAFLGRSTSSQEEK